MCTSLKNGLLSILFLLLATTANAQNLVVNGDFSADTPPNPQAPFGWEATDFDNSQFRYAGVFNDANSYPGGENYCFINGAPGIVPTLAQNVSVVPDQRYRITGNYTTLAIGRGANTFAVQFSDPTTNTVLLTKTYNHTSAGLFFGQSVNWQTFQIETAFNVTSVRLLLKAQYNDSDDDYAVDNIRMTPIPAPNALVTTLLGAAPGALLLLRRRRKLSFRDWAVKSQ